MQASKDLGVLTEPFNYDWGCTPSSETGANDFIRR